MWNRKLSGFKVEAENSFHKKREDQGVQSYDSNREFQVREFVFQPIEPQGSQRYAEVKEKFGPLAATDQERVSKTQKDRRFSVNSLLRNSLAIEEEERRAIDDQVRKIVSEITEQEKKAAREVGYEEGYKRGFEESKKKVQTDAAKKVEIFDRFLNEMEKAREEIFRVNERILIELIYKISKTLLLRELSNDREYLLRVSKEIITKLGVRENITLRINPQEAEVISLLKEGVENAFGNLTNFNIEINSSVKTGGCEIETEWNLISSNIDQQLQEVLRVLLPETSSLRQEAQTEEIALNASSRRVAPSSSVNPSDSEGQGT